MVIVQYSSGALHSIYGTLFCSWLADDVTPGISNRTRSRHCWLFNHDRARRGHVRALTATNLTGSWTRVLMTELSYSMFWLVLAWYIDTSTSIYIIYLRSRGRSYSWICRWIGTSGDVSTEVLNSSLKSISTKIERIFVSKHSFIISF